MPIESINPANNKLLRTFEPLTDEAARQKIALAEDAFRAYTAIPLEHRALWMRKLASILENETEDLATLITLEMGKPLEASRLEILKCADACRYFADHAARILAHESIPTENHSYVRWDPLGIILAVMPWNFPFWQVIRFLAPALMAGNVALLKHAANVPQCALAIESLVRRAGFPRGTFQSLLLEVHQVETILADPRIAAVTVTGSEVAGRAIGAQAGWLLKKSVLELGGSDPFIVMPSADLDLAVETAVRARLVNAGQSCIAAKRFIIADEVYDIFESRFVVEMESVRVGDPMKEGTEIGPLATPRAVEILEAQVKAATRVGARILTGGERMLGEGNYFEPTVLTGVPRTCGRLPRRDLRPRSNALPRHGHQRSHRDRQRHSLRPRRLRLDPRPRRTTALRRRTTVRWSLPQHHGSERPAPPLRRHQALRLRPRALRRRHARIHERKDRSHRLCTPALITSEGPNAKVRISPAGSPPQSAPPSSSQASRSSSPTHPSPPHRTPSAAYRAARQVRFRRHTPEP